MSAPFKPGDRVRVTDWTAPGIGPLDSDIDDLVVGDTGVVSHVSDNEYVHLTVDRTRQAAGGFYYKRFELITEPESVDFDTAWQPGNEIEFTVRGRVGNSNWLRGLAGGMLHPSTAKDFGSNFRILPTPEPPKTFTVEFTEEELEFLSDTLKPHDLLRRDFKSKVADKLIRALGSGD